MLSFTCATSLFSFADNLIPQTVCFKEKRVMLASKYDSNGLPDADTNPEVE